LLKIGSHLSQIRDLPPTVLERHPLIGQFFPLHQELLISNQILATHPDQLIGFHLQLSDPLAAALSLYG
jgi:hypothetical protein